MAASQVAAAPLHARLSTPLKPSEDPFYQPPSGYESTAPGTILKARQLGNNSLAALSVFPQNLAGVHQFLFRTNDGLNQATATVTTLMIPHNARLDTLLSYQTAEDSTGMDCAPSYNLQLLNSFKNVGPAAEILLMDTMLSKGIPVMSTDYEGPKAAFTCGANSGHAVLDGVRAVLSSTNTTGIASNAKVTLWGYSGGALASGWGAQLKKSYADEINMVGAALGGTPVNLNTSLNMPFVNGGPAAGLAFGGIFGLSRQYPDLDKYLHSIMKPEKVASFDSMSTKCINNLIIDYMFQDIGKWVTRADYMADPIATKAINDNMMGKLGAPAFPIFMYHSKNDELVSFNDAESMMKSWCSQGASISFVGDILSEHVILAVTGAADAVNFLMARYNGDQISGCTSRTSASTVLDPGAVATFGTAIFDLLKALLSQPIGPTNSF
ncbi:secretory lipase-domain-containing protein [Gongronella butleri]|nr:secretory lipase-domain-containing protein [Gongronella butleri]